MIAKFMIDQPVLLEINPKNALMGAGHYCHIKNWPLFVRCLSVFLGILGNTKSSVSRPPRIKNIGGKPPNLAPYLNYFKHGNSLLMIATILVIVILFSRTSSSAILQQYYLS